MDGHPSPGHPIHPLVRGVAALTTLLALLLGVPAVLLSAGGDPLGRQLPGSGAVSHAVATVNAAGTVVVTVVVYIAWLAWLAFTVAVLLEVTGRLRRRPAHRMPGLRVVQRSVAGLLTGAAVLTGTAGFAAAAYAVLPPATGVVASGPPAAHPPTTFAGTRATAAPAPARAARAAVAPPTVRGVAGRTRAPLPAETPAGPLAYQVAPGDTLAAIAQRLLGRSADARRIAVLNPGLPTSDAGLPAPGTKLALPDSARDRGERRSARGRLSSPSTTAGTSSSTRSGDDDSGGTPAMSGTADSGYGGGTGAPTMSGGKGGRGNGTPSGTGPFTRSGGNGDHRPTTPVTPARTDGATPGTSSRAQLPVRLAPPVAPPPFAMHNPEPVPHPSRVAGIAADAAGSGGSGPGPAPLLAAGVGLGLLGAHLGLRRRRRNGGSHERPAIEARRPRALAAADAAGAGPAAEFNRLDLALRDLATLISARQDVALPDILGSWLVDGTVHLLLTRPCPAPAPWVENGRVWTLPAHAPAHSYFADVAAPLPALVTVGGRDDQRVFLDLERLGVLTIGGDPQGATGLLRHVGAELCHGIWTEGVTVGIAGFTRQDTQQLVALGGGRVHDAGSIPDALDTAAHFIGVAHDRLADLGVDDLLSARVAARPADAAWLSPYALLLAGPDAEDLQRLAKFDAYLADLGRGQLAIALTTQAALGRFRLHVDDEHQVTMGFLDAKVQAVSLGGAELAALADAPDRPRPRPADQDVPVGRHRARRAPAA